MERLETTIRDAFPDASEVSVLDRTGTGDHFQVVVTSPAFAGLSLVDQHRLRHAPPAPRPARPRLRRAAGAARGRDDPRAANPNEREQMTELREQIQTLISDEPVAL